ncbi:2'-5' RNA ligase family protein [Ramlibacter sp. G-1-2-2]|uniref:2'-5' RNA ligase family protein n=1 Tax=Ramlibacter agri TaxID=2728837 RepID=A0A848HF05_9BURK|nr:2'-5' RNA ligase family protein [Ramlibacter agri]NML46178.1 2'-5' RNA ligase family protein [Ramlibacter agri]
MPERSALYVLAFPTLSPDDASRIEALRADHDPAGHSLLKAHFTFVFGCATVSPEAAEAAMRAVAAQVATIEFSLSAARLSEHGGLQYVFLCPGQGCAEMLELHRRLDAGCEEHSEEFTPHLTVCKTPHRAQAHEALHRASRIGLPMQGTLLALSLGAVRDGRFEVLAEAPLAGHRLG